AEVKTDAFGVPNVQVAVWLRRKAGVNAWIFLFGDMRGDYVADKIRRGSHGDKFVFRTHKFRQSLSEGGALVQTKRSFLVRNQRRELARLRVVGEQFRRGDFEEPAVQSERPVHEAFLHTRVAVQVIEAEQ